jgi:hypothetical protein
MYQRLAFRLTQGPQAVVLAALAVLSCAALLLGFI